MLFLDKVNFLLNIRKKSILHVYNYVKNKYKVLDYYCLNRDGFKICCILVDSPKDICGGCIVKINKVEYIFMIISINDAEEATGYYVLKKLHGVNK